ncbi:MAG: hypothetical protein IK018_01905 [Lachnospiraceae bacterium]|nr:hypothetical protein [Lachnospiraceae bacterium]
MIPEETQYAGLDYCSKDLGTVDKDSSVDVLAGIYSKAEGWSITLIGEDELPSRFFWTPVSHSVDYAEIFLSEVSDSELIRQAYSTEKCYRFELVQKEMNYIGYAWVNTHGRVVAFGRLPGFPDSTNRYRVK